MNVPRLRAVQAMAATALAFPSLGRAAGAADLPVVNVGVTPIEPACQTFYADAQGYFTQEGIAAATEILPTTPAIMQAMLAGTYDFGNATVPTVALGHGKGLPFVIIAPSVIDVTPSNAGGIVVLPNSSIKGPLDLVGKTFAVSGLATNAQYLPRAWVDANHGDSSKIKFVEVPFPAIADAIATGRADAGWLSEPFLSLAIDKGTVKLLSPADTEIASRFLVTAWITTSTWAKAHPDLVARFSRAIIKSAAWANANPNKVVPIVASKLHQDPEQLYKTHRAVYGVKLVDTEIQPSIDLIAKYEKVPSFPASEIIYRP